MASRIRTSVVVPWAGGCLHRERAWDWVRAWWARTHPDVEIVVGEGGSPWRKAEAVDRGIKAASGEIIIVADADVVCDGIEAALAALEAGAPWVIPHHLVHRLNPEATALVLAGVRPYGMIGAYDERPYVGWLGGGLVVMWRGAWDVAPIDPRFEGWGQEDASWAICLDTLIGPHVRLDHDLYHLWHPPQPRLSRRVGSAVGEALWQRYRAMKGYPNLMALLVQEGRAHEGRSHQDRREEPASAQSADVEGSH